ncbi:unnamed protein product [Tetraodon nigroviridis]|uniref:(spotted green pufferfish) hypothetical protein n=1 Tax=Tetraodon nigroviridis TaxID=99883 RepID=Q4SH36_TETNG|nr:unnamed protein product [Tetraodon nigroviridis]
MSSNTSVLLLITLWASVQEGLTSPVQKHLDVEAADSLPPHRAEDQALCLQQSDGLRVSLLLPPGHNLVRRRLTVWATTWPAAGGPPLAAPVRVPLTTPATSSAITGGARSPHLPTSLLPERGAIDWCASNSVMEKSGQANRFCAHADWLSPSLEAGLAYRAYVGHRKRTRTLSNTLEILRNSLRCSQTLKRIYLSRHNDTAQRSGFLSGVVG